MIGHGRSHAVAAAIWIGLTFALHLVTAHVLVAKTSPFESLTLPERDMSCFHRISYLQEYFIIITWIVATHIFIFSMASSGFFQRFDGQSKAEEVVLGSWTREDCGKSRSGNLNLASCRISQVNFVPENSESLPSVSVTIDLKFNKDSGYANFIFDEYNVAMISIGPRLLSSRCFAPARVSKIDENPDKSTLRETLNFDFQQPECIEHPEELRMQIWDYKNGNRSQPYLTFRLTP